LLAVLAAATTAVARTTNTIVATLFISVFRLVKTEWLFRTMISTEQEPCRTDTLYEQTSTLTGPTASRTLLLGPEASAETRRFGPCCARF
jgi:hypothetical protein